jgi:hypothetical protein
VPVIAACCDYFQLLLEATVIRARRTNGIRRIIIEQAAAFVLQL